MNKRVKSKLTQLSILTLVFLLILTSMEPAWVEASNGGKAGTIAELKGDVFVKKGAGKREIKAFKGMGVTQGDTLRTGKNAYARVEFDGDNVASLGENTTITIAELADKSGVSTTKVKQSSGSLWNKVKQTVGAGNTYEVETPTSIMGVRGTMFLTQFDSERTNLSVIDGTVGMRQHQGRGGTDQTTDLETLLNHFEQAADGAHSPEADDLDLGMLSEEIDIDLFIDILYDALDAAQEAQRESEEILEQFETIGEQVQQEQAEKILRARQEAARAVYLNLLAEQMIRSVRSEEKDAELKQRLEERNLQNQEQLLEQSREQREQADQTLERAEQARRQVLEELQEEQHQAIGEIMNRLDEVNQRLQETNEQLESSPPPAPGTGGGGGGSSSPTEQVGTVTGNIFVVTCPAFECSVDRLEPVIEGRIQIKSDPNNHLLEEDYPIVDGYFEIDAIPANTPFFIEGTFYSGWDADYITIRSEQHSLSPNETKTVNLLYNLFDPSEEIVREIGVISGLEAETTFDSFEINWDPYLGATQYMLFIEEWSQKLQVTTFFASASSDEEYRVMVVALDANDRILALDRITFTTDSAPQMATVTGSVYSESDGYLDELPIYVWNEDRTELMDVEVSWDGINYYMQLPVGGTYHILVKYAGEFYGWYQQNDENPIPQVLNTFDGYNEASYYVPYLLDVTDTGVIDLGQMSIHSAPYPIVEVFDAKEVTSNSITVEWMQTDYKYVLFINGVPTEEIQGVAEYTFEDLESGIFYEIRIEELELGSIVSLNTIFVKTGESPVIID